MATLSAAILILSLAVLASAYPYYDLSGWSPQEIAEYLSLQEAAQSKSPVEDAKFDTDGQGIGMVSGVGVDSNGDVLVFHRADRPWTAETFDSVDNKLTSEGQVPIQKDTIFKLNPTTGRKISSLGGNLFNVPHGLTVDKDDNLWLTDVGRHQILRIPVNTSVPDLVLGEKFVPGDDESHFCKPTDVAVASNGDFFVSDGYCNSRVMKFSKEGKFLAKWGTSNGPYDLTPFTLDTPHSIALVEELDLVCVADRENSRALCYNAGLNSARPVGGFNRTLIPQGDMGKVFAIYYNKADKDIIAAADISRVPYLESGQAVYPLRACTYGLDGKRKDSWAYITPKIASQGPSLIHDLASSNDGKDFFLGDIVQQKIFKYSKPNEVVIG